MLTVALVTAHPDDEVFASNMLLGLSQHSDVRLAICCATDGGGGSLRGDPPLVTSENLGDYRVKELNASVDQYEPWQVQVLGLEDGGYSGRPAEVTNTGHGKMITSALDGLQADVVITHGSEGEYGHPLHKVLHHVVCRDAEENDRSVLTFWANTGYNVWDDQTNQQDIASFVLCADGYPSHKKKSVEAHKTQWEYFTGPQPSQRAYRRALHRYAADHVCEAYRFVHTAHAHEGRLLHILRSVHNVRLTAVNSYQEPLIVTATILWRTLERFRSLRYRLGIRTRLRKLITALLQT